MRAFGAGIAAMADMGDQLAAFDLLAFGEVDVRSVADIVEKDPEGADQHRRDDNGSKGSQHRACNSPFNPRLRPERCSDDAVSMAEGIHVGCSGWVYRHWKGGFYPEGLSQKRWFEHYSAEF